MIQPEQGFINKNTIIRIAGDVKDLINNPIDGICYIHDTDDILKGYAMILGPKDSPYDCVPMFYEFNFPNDYPHSPPLVKFKSYAFCSKSLDNVRLHPNYYSSGKCCLSILNTWRGDTWSGCQTIRSILITMQMTMTNFPLENEPGQKGNGIAGLEYRAIVFNAGLNIINNFLNNKHLLRFRQITEVSKTVYSKFLEFFIEYLNADNGKRLLGLIKNKDSELNKSLLNYKNVSIYFSIYQFNYYFDYINLKPKLIASIKNILRKIETNT